MADAADFRRIALTFDGATEYPHFDRRAFKARVTFATLAPDERTANIKFAPDEQALKCAVAPEAFLALDNAWGRRGWTLRAPRGADRGRALRGAGAGVAARCRQTRPARRLKSVTAASGPQPFVTSVLPASRPLAIGSRRKPTPAGPESMAKDQLGLSLAGSDASARAYDRAVSDYWGLTGDPVGALKQALADDPAFALGAAAIAGLFLIGGFRDDHPEVAGALAAAERGACQRIAARKAACRRRQGLGRGPVDRRHAHLGGDPRRLADRRAGAALRPGRLLLPRPVAGDPRFRGARAAGVGSRPPVDELRSGRLRVRPRGDRRTCARRGDGAGGARPQPEGRLGHACAGARVRDDLPARGRNRISQERPARRGLPRISWPGTTAGTSPST